MAEYSFKFKLRNGDDEMYKFSVPQNPGDSGPEVEVLKLYLEVDSVPGESHGTFDTELQSKLRAWQSEYFDDIVAEMPDEEIPEGEARFIANQFTEQGSLGDLTFKAMMRKGFAVAAKQYFESEHYLLVREDDIDELFGDYEFPTGNDETQKPPTINGDYIEYKYVTKYTKQDFEQSSMVLENKEVVRTMFRKAVLKVFDFYNKPKTWNVSGAPRPELPESLSGLYKNAEHLRVEYEKILKAVKRIDATDTFRARQSFSFTVNEQTLQEQLDQSTVEVDVLFGQSMTAGAPTNFASIKEISPPGLRPSATYNLVIKVRRDLFEAIEGGNIDLSGRTGGTFDVTNPDNYRKAAKSYKDTKKKAKQLWKKAGKVGSILNDPSKLNRQVDKLAKGQARKAAKALKGIGNNAWDQARTGQGGDMTDAERQRRAQEATSADNRDFNYGRVSIKLNEFRDIIENVSKKMEEYHSDVEKFKQENSKPRNNTSRFEKTYNPIIPDINPREEARKLREIVPALEEFFEVNGYQLGAGPTDMSEINIIFEEVVDIVYGPSSQQDSSLKLDLEEVTANPTEEGREEVVGWKISSIEVIGPIADPQGVDYLNAGVSIFDERSGKRPFIYPTTMGYLSQLDKIEKDVIDNPCDDLVEGNPALVFFSRWHYPEPSFNFNKKAASGINIDASVSIPTSNMNNTGEPGVRTLSSVSDIFDKSILTAREEFAEQKALASDSFNAIKESTLFEKRGRVIETGDVYPEFGKIPCDIEKMWEEFLNQWDMKLIMCDLRKCIPGLPPFNAKFNFKLPLLPDIPSFDPMHFVLPQLRISLNDIIMSFICKFIQSILDTIRKPDCTDLIRFGLAAFSELQEMSKDDPFANAQEKASTFEKAVDTIVTMGVSGPALGRDSEDVLEAVSLALTPTELCDLLQGRASDDVLSIVLRVIQSLTSNLKEYLNTIDKVEKFFATLGTVVDPFICDRIRELNDIVIAQELCRDDQDLRKLLQDAGASDEQIKSELDALNQKRKILNDLSKKGDFSGLLPGMSAQDLADAGIPGPYGNPYQDKMVKLAVSSVLTNVKSYFDLEIGAFPDKIVKEIQILVQPGDEGFNQLDYARFIHYNYMLSRLANNPNFETREITNIYYKANYTTSNINAYGLNRLGEQHLRYLGVSEEHVPFVNIFPVDSGSGVLPLDKFAENVEKYVVGYIEKYGRIEYEVSKKLKDILETDHSTIARKRQSRGTAGAYREFHVRLSTEVLDQFPVDLMGTNLQTAATSVGIADLPFSDRNIKDCYRFSYYVPGPGSDVLVTKVYSEDVPQPYIDMRSDDLDVVSSTHRDKLLRPGGFAAYMTEKYRQLANGEPLRNSFDSYSDSSIVAKLQGYVEPPNEGIGREVFDSVMDEEEGTSAGELLLAAIAAAIAEGGAQASETEVSLYESLVDSINFQMSEMTTKSKYFDLEEVLDMEESMTSEYRVEGRGANACHVKNKKIFDFEKLVEGFVNKFKEIASKPKHDPSKRDFNKKGPLEESMIEALFKLYVDFCCLELMLKGIFMLSRTGSKNVFDSKMMIDYVTDSVIAELEGGLLGVDTSREFGKIVRSIAEKDTTKESIRSLVVKNIDLKEMCEYVESVYESPNSSFKEKFYNDLVENIKDVPSNSDYPTITIYSGPLESRDPDEGFGGYRDVLVAPKFPNLYDRFIFRGYSEEVIQKKMNSGHFWVERFYRIKDYNSFRDTYNELVNLVRNLPGKSRLRALNNDHAEYISGEDLGSILFGYQTTEDKDRYEQLLEENLERMGAYDVLIQERTQLIGERAAATLNDFLFPQEKIDRIEELNQLINDFDENATSRSGILSEVSFRETRLGAFTLSNSGAVGRRISEKQIEIYNHLKNNLQCGMRLMYGHKVVRSEIAPAGLSENIVEPDEIYKDLRYDYDGNVGLQDGDTTVFTRKKAFLGHTDNEPITSTAAQSDSVSVNNNSVFQNYAKHLVARQNAELNGETYVYAPPTRLPESVKKSMVYSIPMDEVVRDVDCFDELFLDFEERTQVALAPHLQSKEDRLVLLQNEEIEPTLTEEEREQIESRQAIIDQIRSRRGTTYTTLDTSGSGFVTRRYPNDYRQDDENTALFQISTIRSIAYNREIEPLVKQIEIIRAEIRLEGFLPSVDRGLNLAPITQIRRDFLNRELFSKYKSPLSFDLLSIEEVERNKKVVVPSSEDGDYMKAHRVLFDFLLPMDRYSSIHLLQNIKVFEEDNDISSILTATKLFIVQNMLAYEGVGDTKVDGPLKPGTVDNTKNVLNSSVGFTLPSVSDIMRMIAEAIGSAAAAATAAAVRDIASQVDPGYRDMRKGYKKDPCSMKTGLRDKLVSKSNIGDFSGNLQDGFGKKNGCKQYVPITQFPADVVEAALQLDTDALVKATFHLAGTLSNRRERYGYPFTPFGALALSVRENKGERHSKLKKDNSCEDSCETKELVKPEGLCEDE